MDERKQINFTIVPDDTGDAPRLYANFCAISHTPFDFTLSFCEVLPLSEKDVSQAQTDGVITADTHIELWQVADEGFLLTVDPPLGPRLCSQHLSSGDLIRFVRVGTLDTPAALPPDIHIYTRSKLPWVRLPEGVPAVEEYYDSAALWPADSLARRNRALGVG